MHTIPYATACHFAFSRRTSAVKSSDQTTLSGPPDPAVRAAAGLISEASLSSWDALVVVAAARTGAAMLYTEDLNDGEEILGVRIRNPFAA